MGGLNSKQLFHVVLEFEELKDQLVSKPWCLVGAHFPVHEDFDRKGKELGGPLL